MNSSYHIRVEKDYLVFSAGHFITFGDNICERLHGHNYRVAAEVFGPLEKNAYVVDFILLRDELKKIVDRLDHRMLLPTQHPTIQVTATEESVEARFESRRWVFPREDCILLPVTNTTTELLAHFIGQELLATLKHAHCITPEKIRIEVDECYGQLAVCELTASSELSGDAAI